MPKPFEGTFFVRKCLIFSVRLSSGRANVFRKRKRKDKNFHTFIHEHIIVSPLETRVKLNRYKGDNYGARLMSAYSPDLPGQSVQMVESSEK